MLRRTHQQKITCEPWSIKQFSGSEFAKNLHILVKKYKEHISLTVCVMLVSYMNWHWNFKFRYLNGLKSVLKFIGLSELNDKPSKFAEIIKAIKLFFFYQRSELKCYCLALTEAK